MSGMLILTLVSTQLGFSVSWLPFTVAEIPDREPASLLSLQHRPPKPFALRIPLSLPHHRRTSPLETESAIVPQRFQGNMAVQMGSQNGHVHDS